MNARSRDQAMPLSDEDSEAVLEALKRDRELDLGLDSGCTHEDVMEEVQKVSNRSP